LLGTVGIVNPDGGEIKVAGFSGGGDFISCRLSDWNANPTSVDGSRSDRLLLYANECGAITTYANNQHLP
jgi:hypothetical protein